MPKFTKITLLMISIIGISCGALGCVDQDASMILDGNFVKTVDVEDDVETDFKQCQFPSSKNDDGAVITSAGFLDLNQLKTTGQPGLSIPNVFTFGSVIKSQLESNKDAGELGDVRINTNDILISGAEVTFNFNASSLNFKRSFSAIVETQGSSLFIDIPLVASANDVADLEGCVRNELKEFPLTPDQVKLLQVPAFVDIKIMGETLDGQNVESNVFTYPVDICLNCNRSSAPSCIELQGN